MTAEAFGMLRKFSPAVGIEHVREFDPLRDRELLINDFEDAIFDTLPNLRELKRRLYYAGAKWAGMTGSGSTIVGAFGDGASRDAARATFNDVRAEAAESV